MILDKIVSYKKEEVANTLKKGLRPPDLTVSPPRGFIKSLLDNEAVSIIAEAKKASPSKGLICPDFDPAAIARDYKAGGARAISVLTDGPSFQGDLKYIPLVRETVDLPVLRKDFIIHEIQIEEARLYGADAFLLIAAILDIHQMKDFLAMADDFGMDALVEIHDEAEADKALAAGSRIIGVNNRNLQNFTVDLETTFRLKKLIPDDIPLVSESGIRDFADMQRLADSNVCAALIGETLMRADDRVVALRKLQGK